VKTSLRLPTGSKKYRQWPRVDPDNEPTIWTEAEMGRALFWYDGVVNQKFLTVHT